MDEKPHSKCILVPIDEKEHCVRAFDCKYNVRNLVIVVYHVDLSLWFVNKFKSGHFHATYTHQFERTKDARKLAKKTMLL